jgi:hypothetical protein
MPSVAAAALIELEAFLCINRTAKARSGMTMKARSISASP